MHTVSYQNITTQKVLQDKKHSWNWLMHRDLKEKLTVESDNLNILQEAWHCHLERLPKSIVVKTEGNDCDVAVPDGKDCLNICTGLSTPHVFIWGNDREVDDRWHHNARHDVFYVKNTHRLWSSRIFDDTRNGPKKDVGILTFDLIGLLPTNHIVTLQIMVYWSLWGNVWC